jgi:hypothetical protein
MHPTAQKSPGSRWLRETQRPHPTLVTPAIVTRFGCSCSAPLSVIPVVETYTVKWQRKFPSDSGRVEFFSFFSVARFWSVVGIGEPHVIFECSRLWLWPETTTCSMQGQPSAVRLRSYHPTNYRLDDEPVRNRPPLRTPTPSLCRAATFREILAYGRWYRPARINASGSLPVVAPCHAA